MAFIATAAAAVVTTINSAFVAAAGSLLPGLSFGAQVAVANVATKAVLYGAAAMAVSATTVAMLQPKTGAGGSPTDFKADPSAPISGVMGRFGVGGRQAHGNTWGKGNLFISFATVLSLGPIDGIQKFTANEQLVTFPGPQGLAANVEPYKDKMWMTYRLGLPSDAALGPPTGQAQGTPAMSEWTSAHRMPQFAHAFWTMRNNSKSAGYEGGVPKPQWTVRGMKLWDPRKDDTYPGGAGVHRRDDWRTWEWTENPQLHALAWVRGHHKLNTDGTIDLTKRMAGVGAPDEAIDIAAFVAGANIADANGWKIAGEWSTQDDKWQTLASMLQAGGAVPVNRGAHISCLTNTPLASIYHLTSEDLAGPVNLSVMTTRRDRINTIVPRYRSEPHFWEQRAAGPVTSLVYRTEDRNEARTREVAYNFVAQAKQAAELAAYDVATARESLTGSIPCKPHLLGLRAGDAFTATVPEAGLSNHKFVVVKRVFDPGTCVVTLEVRSETDAKHAWALGQAANPAPSPSLTAVDPLPPAPVVEEWTISPMPATPAGTQIPGLEIVGTPPDVVSEVLIEVSTTGTDPWNAIYKGTPPTGSIPAPGLLAGQSYYVRITYFNALGAASEPLVRGPFTAGDLVAGDTTHLKGEPVQDVLDRLTDTATLADQNRQAVEALEDVYGDTASAAESAAAAAASEAAATQAKADALIAKGEAQASATTAATKATEAAGSASSALASKNDAAVSATTATNKAADATNAASTATTQAGLAAGSATAAGGSATAAAGSASTAATKATEAGNSATAANASKVAAESARNTADQKATAAASSASAAATSATNAGTSAGAAQTAKAAAETARAGAETAQTSAANSATTATGAAATATTQAGIATTAKNDAQAASSAAVTAKNQASSFADAAGLSSAAATSSSVSANLAAAQTLPSRPGDDLSFFTGTLVGPPSGSAPLAATVTTASVAGVGAVAQTSLPAWIITKGWVPIGTGRTHEVRVRMRVLTDGSFANRTQLGFRLSNAAGLNGGSAIGSYNQSASDGWVEIVHTRTSEQMKALSADSTHFRPGAFFAIQTASTSASGATVQVDSIVYRDVTEVKAAEVQASAAATSASNASASETAAGQSASAASTAKTEAETARGLAQTAATQAASSRDDAAGSAASASSSATNAANSRDAAAGSANAAAGSASTASTKANEAGISAASALSSQVSASTARDEAMLALLQQGRTNLVARENVTPDSPVSAPTPSLSGWGFTLTGTGSGQERSITVGPLKQSTPYSVSFKARRSIGTGASNLNVDLYPDTLPERVFQIDENWTDFKWEGLTSSHPDMTLPNVRLRFFRSPLASGVQFEITDIKLEEGATATAWTPSPKDAPASAQAAATSASSAAASETAAGQSASAAQGSATTAATQAGNAQTYANQASSSAGNAQAAAITAGTAAVSATQAAAETLPSRPSDMQYFTSTLTGLPENAGPLAPNSILSAVNVAGEGNVLQITGRAQWVNSIGWRPIGEGRTHRVTIKTRVVSDGALPNRLQYGFRLSNASNFNGGLSGAASVLSASDGWQVFVYEATSQQMKAGSPDSTHFRPAGYHGVDTGSINSSGATVQVAYMIYEDVTSEKAAATSAATAVAQAANASASAASAQLAANLAAQVGHGGGYHINPTWADWSAGALPPGGQIWGAATTARNTASARYGVCLEATSTTGSNGGVQLFPERFVTPGPVSHVVIEYEVLLQSGSFRRSGLQASIQDGGVDRNAAVHLFDEHGVGVAGQTYTGAKLVKLPVAAANPNGLRVYLFNNVSDLNGGTGGAKKLIWQRVNVRAPTSSEIETGTVLPAVQAQASLALSTSVDAITRMGQSAFELILASGGNPAYIKALAEPGGTEIAFAATKLLLRNVVGNQIVTALELINGEAYFGAPVSVDIDGRRLTIGPGFGASGSKVVMWFGPNTVTLASMSRTNGYFSLGTDGKVYYGSAELGGGGGGVKTGHYSGALSLPSSTALVDLNGLTANSSLTFGLSGSGLGTGGGGGGWEIREQAKTDTSPSAGVVVASGLWTPVVGEGGFDMQFAGQYGGAPKLNDHVRTSGDRRYRLVITYPSGPATTASIYYSVMAAGS